MGQAKRRKLRGEYPVVKDKGAPRWQHVRELRKAREVVRQVRETIQRRKAEAEHAG
jgi:hypothetical protein